MGSPAAECKPEPEPRLLAALRCQSPGLDALRRNIMIDFDIHEESQTTTEVPASNSSTSHSVSGSPPHTRTPDLVLGPAVSTDINNILTGVINSWTDSEEPDTLIKEEYKYVVPNELPLYKNRIILGKINVDDDEERKQDPPNNFSNFVSNNNEAVIEQVKEEADSNGNVPEANQNHEKEKCLLAVVVTDCMESLLRSERYCAECAVLFPARLQYYNHCIYIHKQAPPARAKRPLSLRIKNKIARTNLTCGSCLPMSRPHIHKDPLSGTGRCRCKSCRNKAFKLPPKEPVLKATSNRNRTCPTGGQLPEHSNHKQNILSRNKAFNAKLPPKESVLKAMSSRAMTCPTGGQLPEVNLQTIHKQIIGNLEKDVQFVDQPEKPNECKTCKKIIRHDLSECSNCINNRKLTRNNLRLHPHDRFIRRSEKPNECKTCKKRIEHDIRKPTRNNHRINTHDKSRLNQQFIKSHLRRWKHKIPLKCSVRIGN